MTAPSPPRFEARQRDGIPGRPSFGIFDTFVQCWLEHEVFATREAAERAAWNRNREYAG